MKTTRAIILALAAMFILPVSFQKAAAGMQPEPAACQETAQNAKKPYSGTGNTESQPDITASLSWDPMPLPVDISCGNGFFNRYGLTVKKDSNGTILSCVKAPMLQDAEEKYPCLITDNLSRMAKTLRDKNGALLYGFNACGGNIYYSDKNGYVDDRYTVPCKNLEGFTDRQKEILFRVMEAVIQSGEPYPYTKKDAEAIERGLMATWFPYYGNLCSEERKDGTCTVNQGLTASLAEKNIAIRRTIQQEMSKADIEAMADEDKLKQFASMTNSYFTFDKKYAGLSCSDYIDSLQDKKGVCQDYAQMFAMMCWEEGFECRIIFGESDKGYHAWNQVRIDGSWKYIDVEWSGSGGGYWLSETLWDDHWDPEIISIREMY